MTRNLIGLVLLLFGGHAVAQDGGDGSVPDSKLDIGFTERGGRMNLFFVRFEDQLFMEGGEYEAFCEKHKGRDRAGLSVEVLADLRGRSEQTWKQAGAGIERLVRKGKIEGLKRYWIVNGFAGRADFYTLEALAEMEAVDFVYRIRGADQTNRKAQGRKSQRSVERALKKFAKDWKSDADEPFTQEGLEIPWNVERIQAPEVWGGGHTGQGVVVALLDTGLLATDSLTRALWRNPDEQPNGKDDDGNGYVDDLFGWNFRTQQPFVPEASGKSSHGSMCAGIVAGRPYNGKKLVTGIAPRARIMVLQGMGQLEAYEYALENGADLLSMSYMWVNQELGHYRGVFRLAHEHMAAAGVLACGGAGNFGPGSRKQAPAGHQIAMPKDIPCVVAAAGILKNGKLAPASSEGPCTWDGVRYYDDYPAGKPLQKPDVTAFFGGYPVWNSISGMRQSWKVDWEGPGEIGLITGPRGNSFSGPHAIGVAALMLSANPKLQPCEIQAILRSTAKDLGPKGWDTKFGAGLMQALPAVAEALRRAGE
ncbi:MAG: S8 family serine peptidase [Planctomycetes bacterium]|nr:S8 family serine peptidase [Planctomycetota bacterium]